MDTLNTKQMAQVQIEKLHDEVQTPEYATEYSAGFDIAVDNFKQLVTERIVYIGQSSYVDLYPGERLLVGTGFKLAIPQDFQLEIRSRSGKTLKEGLVVANAPGTIDADYRGEVGVILLNVSHNVIRVNKGDKVAQGVLMNYYVAKFQRVSTLPDTVRGIGGFGSTDLTSAVQNLKDLKNDEPVHLPPMEGRSIDHVDY